MRILIFTALLAAASRVLAAPDPQPANGGFEQLDARNGLPLGWTAWQTPSLCSYTLAAAHSGVACASVTDDSTSVSQGLRSPRVPVTGGKTYLGAGQVWITRLQASGFAIYLEFWRGDERLTNYAVSTSDLERWVELKVQQTAPAEATEATLLIYGSSATVGHAYFDDLSLTPVGP